jgi:hypothetical protein
MTPFEVGLESEFNLEQLRFANEWLFRWHNLNIEGKVVDVDRFDGGRIHLGGIMFGDQQQSIYWQAIGRYLNGKVHAAFRKWDEETKGYPSQQRRSSLEGASRLLSMFVAGIIRRGIKTDQTVRRQGQPKTDEPYQVAAVRTAATGEIERLKTAHLGLMPAEIFRKEIWWRRYWDALNIRPGMFGFSVDLKKLFQRREP